MDFQQPYNRKTYLNFFRDTLLPEDFEITDEPITPDFQTDRIQRITKIGQIPSLDLPVYEMKHKSENDPRVTLSKESFRILANYGKQQALILFISTAAANFRLSLVTLDLKLEDRRVKKEYSNPRRYSFFLGPGCKTHTPQEYLVKKGQIKDLDDLKSRFSIEVVNKDFYQEIAILFTRLTGGSRKIGSQTIDEGEGLLTLPDKQNETIKKEFAVRLIGRLIFSWFLKKKTSKTGIPLIPEEILSAQAIEKKRGLGGYYHSTLEPLFFEVLNTPIIDRKKPYKNGLWKLIPFLNGGLFTPHEHDFYELFDTGTSKHISSLNVPDDWLKDLLTLFETYNFTIDENTPVDIELSIEPEMLGRIFENLLAEINPETKEITRKKETGSYYTPRSIVEYMVDESLKQYLLTKTGLPEDRIVDLLSYSDEENRKLTDQQKEAVIEALHAVRIVDPACGSGAFPMGILQKILLILQKLDPDSRIWLEKLLSVILDPMYRKELKKKIKVPNYLHKLGIIRDCIFGVDIQPIAVEISKLRCFLSLIVDEKVDDEDENRGIEHLPNLEFKFVCANTLIGLPESENSKNILVKDMYEDMDNISKLKELRQIYLTSYGKDKERIEEDFKKVQSAMLIQTIKSKKVNIKTLALQQWKPFSDEACSWFDPDWMYGIIDGFDIVIGNPPYIDSETMVNLGLEDLRNHLVSTLKFTRGNWDIYIAFLEVGFNLLNKSGIITYITPDKWISKPFGYKLRKNLLQNYLIITESGRDVFESSNVDSIITFIGKNKSSKLSVCKFTKEKIEKLADIPKQSIIEPFTFDWLFSNHIKFITSIERFTSMLSDIGTCDSACATSDAYKLKEYIINIPEKTFTPEKYLKVINTGTIDKYINKWGRTEMKYLGDKFLFPAVNKLKFLDAFSNTYGAKSVKQKLIIKGLTLLDVCYDDIGEIIPGKSTLIVTGSNEHDLKFLLGLLNSKLPIFYIKEKYRSSSYNQGINFNKGMINNLPIPNIDEEKKHAVVKIVDKILKIKKSDPTTNTIELEQQIDQIVYELYGLTDAEIAIVEDSI